MNDIRIEYGGRIVNGNGCFRDVMREFPYETLWELLNDPRPIDYATLEYVVNWCRPRAIKGRTFADVAVEDFAGGAVVELGAGALGGALAPVDAADGGGPFGA